MSNKIRALALFLVLAFGIAHANPLQYENLIIENVRIIVFPDSDVQGQEAPGLKAKIKSREGDLFSQNNFDTDLKTLAEEYDRIEPEVQVIDNSVHITIKLWPRPLIRSIQWVGNERTPTSKLVGELGIKTNQPFNRKEFNEAFNKIKAFYVKQGFFEAQLEYRVVKDPGTNAVDIEICITEGRAGMIKDIIFHNFSKREQNEILEMIYTKKYILLMSWITGQGHYNEEAVQQDEFVILNYLQNKGYADARVSIDVEEAVELDRIILHITADKGDQYLFGNITFEGNDFLTDEEIERFICIDCYEAYSTEKIQGIGKKIMDLYGRKGYIDAIVNYEPRLVDGENRYDVHFTIDEGEIYRVGMIKVFGNHLTQAKVILHETLLCPGDVFNMDRLKLTERKLINMGYFETVNVYAVRSEGLFGMCGNYRDIHIEVEEGNTGSFGAFAGFSTNESIFGGFNITEKNFNILGLGRVLQDGPRALRGGGEFAHFTTTVGKKSLSYVFSWTKPYFLDTPWSIGFDLESSRNRFISEDYEIRANGFTAHATYICNPFLKTSVHYRLRDSKVDVDLTRTITKKVKNEKGEIEEYEVPISDKQRDEANSTGIVSAAGASLLYDSTNHPFIPTAGIKSRFDVEIAGIGGDYQFLSFGYLNKYYYDLFGCATFKFRSDLRFIQPILQTGQDHIPLDERFFLGGDNTIRGFRPYKLGPQYAIDNDPRGGISMAVTSMEIGKWFAGGLAEVFVFYDAGSLKQDTWKIGTVYQSVGIGTRLQVMGPGSPPLTVGWGHPITSAGKKDVKNFFLSAGGYF